MYRPDLVPVNPWDRGDAASAKANRRLPPAHGIIPNAPPIPPNYERLRPRNAYPYDFWPNPPWDPEPGHDVDPSLAVDLTEINIEEDVRVEWIATRPFMWPVQNEDDWENKRYLGAGAYGCAGLWCQRDQQDNIIDVSTIME